MWVSIQLDQKTLSPDERLDSGQSSSRTPIVETAPSCAADAGAAHCEVRFNVLEQQAGIGRDTR
jgi:hypothetical protein